MALGMRPPHSPAFGDIRLGHDWGLGFRVLGLGFEASSQAKKLEERRYSRLRIARMAPMRNSEAGIVNLKP